MTMGGQTFAPKDWHFDLSTDYATHFPSDIGFSISFSPRDFTTDGLSPEDFVAEPVHFPAWGAVPDDETLMQLCRTAARLFGEKLLQRRIPASPDTDEDTRV